MPPRRNPQSAPSSGTSTPQTSRTTTTPATTSPKSSSSASSSSLSSQSAQEILQQTWRKYLESTPQRVKLIDVFMAFLVVVGVVQFVYAVLGGGYPFNAFLSGFGATVGQFVLTASLRIQTNPENKSQFKSVSQERAFADFIFGSLILHFFCVNFIN